jgi:non-homologous end joining protein Ku
MEMVTAEADEEEEAAAEGVIDIMSLLKKSVAEAKGKEEEAAPSGKAKKSASGGEKRSRSKRKTA